MVKSIHRDSRGFMWFATNEGLCRFDGYRYRTFKYYTGDSTSISSDVVNGVIEDESGAIWASTYSGLNKYDRKKNTFSSFYIDEKINTSKPTNAFLKSEFDTNGQLWTLVIDKGLFKLNQQTRQFEEITFAGAGPEIPPNIYITAFDADDSGFLWLAYSNAETGLGLYRYNVVTREAISYSANLHQANPNPMRRLTCVMEDTNGNVWIGYNSGVNMINVKTGKITNYIPWEGENQWIQGAVEALEEDDEGMIWVGTLGSGLLRLDPATGQFDHFLHDPKNKKSISSDNVYSILNDHQGILWIGTDNGLNRISLQKKAFHNFLYAEEDEEMESAYVISDLCTDQQGIMWFCNTRGLFKFDGTHPPELMVSEEGFKELIRDDSGKFWLVGSGLFSYDPVTDKLERFGDSTLNTVEFWSLYKDQEETLWMGTGGSGLYGLNIKTGKLSHFLHDDRDPHTITTNEVGTLFRDGDNLWIGPYKGGLNCINLKSGKIKKYFPAANDPESLSHSVVSAIHKDKMGRMWIGTNQGLNLLDQNTGKFLRIQEKDGLASNYISVNGISEDKTGTIWVATKEGISKINPKTFYVRNYDSRDGFQKNTKTQIFQDKNGRIIMFGQNGITAFQPEDVKDNSIPPQVSITDFLLFGERIKPGADAPIKQEISETDKVTLSYKEDFFTIEFAAHNYLLSEKNQYAYRLEGFDDWTYCGTRRLAYYTNVPPGNYTFRVKASNNDGIWSEQGKTLNIVITPPFWQMLWFRILMVTLLILVLYGLYRWRVHQHYLQRKKLEHLVKVRTKEVEAQKEELSTIAQHLKLSNREITLKNKKIVRQAHKLKMIDQLKSQFLANVSHEFRTPLTLILCPLEELIAKFPGNSMTKSQLTAIRRNANRLLHLINQLLDLSKIENGTLPLDKVHTNLLEHLRAIVHSFDYLAQKNQISYQFRCEDEEVFTDFDPDKIEKIFYNLISNAFKFTPQGGKICITAQLTHKEKKGYIKIDVTDSGMGISTDHLPHIFDRFYQGETSKVKKTEGTGIGLALTKELVELHQGKIRVDSEPGTGSRFTVFLPITATASKIHELPAVNPEVTDDLLIYEEMSAAQLPLPGTLNKTAPVLLIVEDNKDLRTLVKDIFSDRFRIEEAADGIEGWKIASKKIPDFIISDVMMPGRDGLSLCSQIKNDPSTSHIPTILLSAKSTSELDGLTIGADDYIIKPFNAQALALKVKNILTTRQKMWKSLCEELGVQDPSSLKATKNINEYDQRFIERATEITSEHLRDTKFEMETLYKELAMSRTLVYKKMKSLTGLSPNEFVRQIKLNKAAQLLKEGELNVTEVMYEVGFSHRSYFVNCFRKQFGKIPSEYTYN